jgi:hypothetical protein
MGIGKPAPKSYCTYVATNALQRDASLMLGRRTPMLFTVVQNGMPDDVD